VAKKEAKLMSQKMQYRLRPTRHTFRRVAYEASKAETALSGSVIPKSVVNSDILRESLEVA